MRNIQKWNCSDLLVILYLSAQFSNFLKINLIKFSIFIFLCTEQTDNNQ